MCFPPFCHPAQHVLGCFGLRQGATGVLVINASYGLCLVIVHALLLGEVNKGPSGEASHVTEARAPEMQQGYERRLTENEGVGWLVQILDLDIGWGHRLLGFDDQANLVAGLIYGIVIICACAYMFHSIQSGGGGFGLPNTTRWFVAFMNLELLMYIGVVLVKLPELCKMQAEFMPNLTMECPVQRFMFLQRMVFLIIAASLCIWVFSSFAFSLTFGTGLQMDRPEFADHLDMRDAHITGKPPGGPPNGGAPYGGQDGRPYGGQGTAPYQTRHSLSSHTSLAAGGGRHSLVGGAVHAPTSFHSVRSQPPAGGRTSYNIGNMARAGSSMISSTSEHSHPETQSLIKPPLHVF
eukprot:gb/GFBE01070343.1/.p1 GENE.gb/GFBE01070343.1/~~gb/GFBE01070343.1/.p1  ORF type:complete len:351 (+),score=31.38 gb/GFBE01070343.1/:1-1053(+)